MTGSDRLRNPRRRLYATRRDHLRALWEERLRAAAEDDTQEDKNMNAMKAEFEAMSTEQVESQVRAILDPGPWQVVTNFTVQGYALWEVQGKRDKPWLSGKRGGQQCTGCGAIFGGREGFTKHRTGMRCNNPADLGLTRAEDGVWRSPTPVFGEGDGVLGALRPSPTQG